MKNLINRFKNHKPKKTALIILISLFLVFFLISLIAYFKRDDLLNKLVLRSIDKAKLKYNLNVKIGSYGFNGLSAVHFRDITVVPEGKDSLANIPDFTVGVRLFPLIFGDVKISELQLNNALITLVKKDSTSNYDFLFKKDNSKASDKKESIDLADFANKIIHQALDKIPDDMSVKNFTISFVEDTTRVKIVTEYATIIDNDLDSKIILNNKQAVWHIIGKANPSNQKLDLKLFADGRKVELPYLERKYGLKINFDTVRTVMNRAEKKGSDFEIEGSWSVINLLINHPKIASNDVIVPNSNIDAKVIIGKDFVSIDSTSSVFLGKASIHPYIKIALNPHKIYELKLNASSQDAQEIFNAFPIGLFESLEGIKVKGKLAYNLNFKLDSKHPDDVIFSSTITPDKEFKIVEFGKTNFKKINSDFIYTPYEKGKPVRQILVGESNYNYVPINQISPYIQNALLTSEDPSFYSHKGFVEESIRQSIATNFKAKSFKRGGSTISMQLVKNIYLNREKTVARKIEEILIVWLIESQKLTTKSRMFEVYLNIIEWGRNVYGIGEAAQYYFGKRASDLTLGESIYLAHIVPKPKSSLYAWEHDGSLKPYLRGYFNLIGGLMARRGFTESDSSSYGYYGVRLRESLRQQIAPVDSIPDSLDEDDSEDLFQLFKIERDSVSNQSTLLLKMFGGVKKDTVKSARDIRREKREKRKQGIETD
jgi:hypothetical protein